MIILGRGFQKRRAQFRTVLSVRTAKCVVCIAQRFARSRALDLTGALEVLADTLTVLRRTARQVFRSATNASPVAFMAFDRVGNVSRGGARACLHVAVVHALARTSDGGRTSGANTRVALVATHIALAEQLGVARHATFLVLRARRQGAVLQIA